MSAAPIDSELDSGPHGHERERLCAVTRAVCPIIDLIRFVVGPGGDVVPDLKCKLPGRGVWITATQTIIGEAVGRNVFARGFGRNVRVADDLVAQIEHLLGRSALDALAMAGKAGLVARGFGKVEAALTNEEVVALLHAREASADGVRKLAAAERRRTAKAGLIAVIDHFPSAQLDLALGRANVIHAALLAGAPSDTFLARFWRLQRFRTGDMGLAPNRARPGGPAKFGAQTPTSMETG